MHKLSVSSKEQAAALILLAHNRRQAAKTNLPRIALHDAQVEVVSTSARFNTLACGRRWGKTELGIDLALDTLAMGYPVGWFAPNYKIFSEAWNRLTRWLKPVTVRSNRMDRVIEISTGGIVEGWTLEDQDAGRSRKYKRAIIDEAALAPNLRVAWEESIRPTLADLVGDAWFLSSTRGRNFFWNLWQRGQDPLQSEYASWQMPTESNPYISPHEIEAARLELPEAVFEQEFLAVFLEHEGAVFRNIANCLNAAHSATPEQHANHTLVMGVDWGKHHDFTSLSVGCVDCRAEVALDRFNQIDYAFQRGRLMALYEKWKPLAIQAEQNAMGEPIIEQLLRDGLPVYGFMTTGQTKPPLIESLALAFEREEWQFLSIPFATLELEAYERRVSTATGRSSYSAPDGGHDDTVIARALMVFAGSQTYTDAGDISSSDYHFSNRPY